MGVKYCGCGTEISGYAKRCKACDRIHKTAQNTEYKARQKELEAAEPQIEVMKPAPRKPPMSEARRQRLNDEQRRLDRAVDERYVDKVGLRLDPGRQLNEEEKAAVLHTIRHISQIQHREMDTHIYTGAI